MATAKERVSDKIIERIPHNTVSFAYLQLEAGNWNEFKALRDEVVANHPMYAFAANVPAEPKAKAAVGRLTAAQKAKLTGESEAAPPAEPATTTAGQEATSGESAAPEAPAPAPSVEAGQEDQTSATEPATQAPAPADTTTEGLTPRELARQKMLAKREGK